MSKNFREVYNLELIETRHALEMFYLLVFHAMLRNFPLCIFFFT